MSILLDNREDSHLASQLQRFGLPITTCRLDFGDLVIEAAQGLLIGYERKRLTDLISSMQDRRLSGHQLRGMLKVYDRVEIIVEGVWRPGENGEIEIPGRTGWQTLYHQRGFNGRSHGSGGISFRQLDSYLYSQYEMGGVPYWRTGSPSETSHLIASRYHWWQKDYELHKSHDVLFTNNPSAQRRGSVILTQGDPNPVTVMAAQIPGIDAKAWCVGKYFKSPTAMVEASEAEWRRCPWTDRKGQVKHFGAGTAKEIVRWLRGGKEAEQK